MLTDIPHNPHWKKIFLLLQRLMSNLALAKVRTGVAAAVAGDRDAAVQRKSELLLGPVPFDPASLLTAEDLKAVAAAATPEPTMVTSTGRRVKVCAYAAMGMRSLLCMLHSGAGVGG